MVYDIELRDPGTANYDISLSSGAPPPVVNPSTLISLIGVGN